MRPIHAPLALLAFACASAACGGVVTHTESTHPDADVPVSTTDPTGCSPTAVIVDCSLDAGSAPYDATPFACGDTTCPSGTFCVLSADPSKPGSDCLQWPRQCGVLVAHPCPRVDSCNDDGAGHVTLTCSGL
jgi:hypothetical protein